MKRGKQYIEVDDLILVKETPKAYGVIPKYIIDEEIDHREVTHPTQLRDRVKPFLVWIPKSRSRNEDIYENDMFQNMRITYPLDNRPDKYPYKTNIKLEVQSW